MVTAAAVAAAVVISVPALAGNSAASAPSPEVIFGFKNVITITGAKTIGKLSLPAGGWVIFAKADALPVSGTAQLLCKLTAGNSEDQTPPEPSAFLENFALSIAHTFTRPGSATLTCDSFSATVNLIKVKITAIKAGTLSVIRL